ncbi:xanthine dehydrogenase, molybdenum binding subunit apoprotein [Streptomyces sp. 2323.1]|uniref:xanthine dehydrogenase family protein molybdopterin-binding subunit n=1 Tax=Streptomyces sp. 2323.1 TaxID=1938841 RepID=UPI000BB92BC7|nr:xanthine dehydrogenase family protein molybdopterin-binding subunit [Streptomyces sp. 2323.1]SOE09275.1 xanthine dehydrogenase, molybdenum binding subunit apoprotein [Streptomyces sp. 2323.1]
MTTGSTLEAVGRPLDRVDGPAKVTGSGRYAAEFTLPGTAYAALVGARTASGRIIGINTGAAEDADGVLAVLTHRNLPKVAAPPHLLPSLAGHAAPGESFFPMQDEVVHYFGQPVAMVIADSSERAQFAARQIHVDYARDASVTTLEEGRDQAYEPEAIFAGFVPARSVRGDIKAGFAAAAQRLDATYHFAANHHHPIEPSATTAVWDGDRLTLYDATQGIVASQRTVAALLGIPPSKVRVRASFVGGGFGCKAMIWPHVTLAAMAARWVRRPVKLALTREQMATSCGHREEQEQRIELGATDDGRLTALRHHKLSLTSPFDEWAEPSLSIAAQAYACPHYEGVYRLIRSNTMTPTFTRGPGETTGMFALECTMDELAHRIGVDPVQLRLRNHAHADPNTGHPWSSDGAQECYRRGAARFDWQSRNPELRSERDGNWLIGKGMATAGYPVFFPMQPQRARARLYADGSAVVQAGTQEFGTGAATAMTQVAADGLGVPLHQVRFEYGDTDLPNVAATVGSAGAGMISAAVHTAVTTLRDQLIAQAVLDPASPLHGSDPPAVVVRQGRMELRDDSGTGETYHQLMERHFMTDMEALGSWSPPAPDVPYGLATFGAQFAEVAVDQDLGLVRVRRMVGAFAPGRVLNAKTARSQAMGGMLWGIGQALLEGAVTDPRDGRWANAGLGEYLLPVNADAPDVAIEFVEVPDPVVNPLGVKGLGEVGMVGAAAAIANAVFHATGYRARELPIRIEHLL